KVDRKLLPPPLMEETLHEKDGPRTKYEEVLAGIWSDVLKLKQVGINDNFFELGGHSLIATQVISRIREAFDVEIPLRSLFESPTVTGLAKTVEWARATAGRSEELPILPVGRDGDLPLSFAQQGLWLRQQLNPTSSIYNIPIALRLRGALVVWSLQQS